MWLLPDCIQIHLYTFKYILYTYGNMVYYKATVRFIAYFCFYYKKTHYHMHV